MLSSLEDSVPLAAVLDSVVGALAWVVAVGVVAVVQLCVEEVKVAAPHRWQWCPLILPSVVAVSVEGGAVGVGSVLEAA